MRIRGRMLALGLAGAISLGSAATAVAEDTLKIGFVGGQTGYLAIFDQPVLQGAEMAINDINAAGGIDGKIKLELISRDMRSETAQSAVMAQELVGLGISILVTPCDVDPSVAAGQIAAAEHIVAISGCATPPILPGIVGEYMFLNATPDNLQGAVLGDYAIKQGYKTAVTLISRDTPYTEKLPGYFGEAFEAKGGKVIGVLEYKMGQQDFAVEVSKIKEMNPAPDVIMTSAYEPDFPAFIKQLRSAGITTPVLGSDGLDSPTIFGLGSMVDGVVYTNGGYPSEGSRLAKFNEQYKKVYGKEPDTIFTAVGYDLIQIIEAAVKGAGDKTDGESIRKALNEIDNLPIASGTITYKGMDRSPLRMISLIRISNGKKEHIGDVMPNPTDVPKP